MGKDLELRLKFWPKLAIEPRLRLGWQVGAGARLIDRRLIFSIRTSHRSSNFMGRFGWVWPTYFPPPKKKATRVLKKFKIKIFSKLNTLVNDPAGPSRYRNYT